MKVVVTGASGFVMSVLVRRLLESDPEARVTALDLTPPDDLSARFLGEHASRVSQVCADVRDATAVRAAVEADVDVVVHGATLTHAPASEREAPGRYLDVNVGGTVAVLDAIRAAQRQPRLLYLSSGAVYGADATSSPRHEHGPVAPVEMYGISKLAAEAVVRRYGELFGVRAVVARPAKVFGAMERPTGARTVMSVPYRLARAAVFGERLRVTARTFDAAGDWVDAHDVAGALHALLDHEAADGDTYHTASGVRTPFRALVDAAERWAGRTVVDVAEGGVDLDLDPDERWGKDGAYAVDRIAAHTGWRPRPVVERFGEYLDWAARNRAVFQR